MVASSLGWHARRFRFVLDSCLLEKKGNDVAIALYEGMGFEMAALEDEMMARSRRRPPRIYLSKPLKR